MNSLLHNATSGCEFQSLSLGVKDFDFARREILVRSGKGYKDRRVPLPRLIVPALTVQMDSKKQAFEENMRHGISSSALPEALGSPHIQQEQERGVRASDARTAGLIAMHTAVVRPDAVLHAHRLEPPVPSIAHPRSPSSRPT